MRLTILAIGRMKAGPERELFDRYRERAEIAGRQLHFKGPEIIELPEARAKSADLRKSEEAEAILKSAGNAPRIILLDEFGKDIDSRGFSQLIMQEQDAGTGQLSFALGGPDGHGEALKNSAIRKIRFGSMTWPHQIARVMLAEQIYRAMTILSGHPYHRD